VRDGLWRRARAVPSLDLRFADNKSLVDAVTGASLVTFTRASSKTVTNSAGVLEIVGIDVPAFDHNPTTGESLGLLVEEQRTNLCLQSENLGTTWTTAAVSVTANQRTAPDGALSMDTVTATGGAGFLQQAITVVDSTVYAASVYVFATSNRTRLILHNGSSDICNVAWTSISANTTSVSGTASSIASTLVGNGIYRLSFTFTSTSTTANFRIQPLNSSGNAVAGATGDFWGAQLEAGSTPSSYIPTTTAAVTRSADVASITGSAFSSWYRQDEGTVFADYTLAAGGAVSNAVFSINNNTTNNRILLRPSSSSGSVTFFVLDADVLYAGLNTTGGSVTSVKAIIAYRTDDIAATRNGGALALDASATIPTVTQINMGADVSNSTMLNGTIRRLAFWGQRLPNNILQSITQ
jgi:hypothetical protein